MGSNWEHDNFLSSKGTLRGWGLNVIFTAVEKRILKILSLLNTDCVQLLQALLNCSSVGHTGGRWIFQVLHLIFSHCHQESIGFKIVSTNCPTEMYFLIHPQGWINDERMAIIHCLELDEFAWTSTPMYIPIHLSYCSASVLYWREEDIFQASVSSTAQVWGDECEEDIFQAIAQLNSALDVNFADCRSQCS